MYSLKILLVIVGARYLIVSVFFIALFSFTKIGRKGKIEMLLFSAITLPLIYLVAMTIAFVYFDPRPFVVGHFIPLIPHDPDNGFPSDHTLLSSAIAMVVYVFNKKWGVVILILTAMIGISRVLAGVHHLADVIGSIFISAIVAFAVYEYIFPVIKKRIIKNL